MTFKTLLFAAGLHLFFVTVGQAQRFYSVVFNKLPQDYQLYPRNEQNEGTIPITGIVEAAGWKYISVSVSRNNIPFKYLRAAINYQNNGLGNFSTEARIKAELAQYDFKVYVCKDGDSVLVVNRQQVVSGDVYILSGQSNSTGFFTEADTNRFCRTFGKITDNLNTFPYNPADTLWALSNIKPYDNGVGTMGFEIQKQLMQQSGIPNCLINAGVHWSSAFSHAIRTESNPTDLNTAYGRMLYRVQKAGLTNSVKAYIFRQGETEAYHEGFNWEENFDRLRKYLKSDFPNLQKFYVFQIDIIYYPSPIGAIVRDYQRRLPEIYPDIRSIATVGTKQFDGLHYGREGNMQSGQEVSRLIGRDFYGLTDTVNINSPSLKKAFYANNEKKQLILVFDEGQELVYPDSYKPNGNITLEMKDFFYLDGSSGGVAAGKADGNRVILELNGPQGASILHYLPMYLEEGGPYYPFNGPFIKNKLGMRAFTFFNVPITVGLPKPELLATENVDKKITLSWQAVEGATEYVLEKKSSENGAFEFIAKMGAADSKFIDTPDQNAEKIIYRLKAIAQGTESVDYAYAELEMPVVLGTEKDHGPIFSVFPNPVVKNEPVHIRFNKPVSGVVSIVNANGQYLSGYDAKLTRDMTVIMPSQSSGLHFIQFKSEDSEWSRKILVH
jgi:hypothetical protein